MFIFVAYKDAPELSSLRRQASEDLSQEKTLLVNPACPVRIMLEYIRRKCSLFDSILRLGTFTQFDLCDETGGLMGLFSLPTYVYVTDRFEHKKTYYIIVMKTESDKRLSVLPQLNHENRIYVELKNKVKKFLATGDLSPQTTLSVKTVPSTVPVKPALKKK